MTESEVGKKEEVETGEHTLVLQPRTKEVDSCYTTVSSHHTRDKILASLGAFLITGVVLGISTLSWGSEKKEVPSIAIAEKIEESIPKEPETPNPFEQISIGAKAAIVYDVAEDRVLYGYNEDTPLPLASLTKLMTGLVALKYQDQKERLAVSPYALETEGDSGLLASETWNLKDLVSFTMITSSNDGADALAAAVGSLFQTTDAVSTDRQHIQSFVSEMNTEAKNIGLKNTHFSNATGLDVSNGGGGVGTAVDMSKLLTYIWKNSPEAITNTDDDIKTFISEDGFSHVAENTNEIVFEIPGLIGGKTGYTDLAGGNLAVLYDAGFNHPIAIVVLGSSREGRFADVKTLVDATYAYTASGWAEYHAIAGSTVTHLEDSSF